jgi:excisionase family DNA binding protein
MKDQSVTFQVKSTDVVSVTSAAKMLGVHRITIYRWINSGKIISVQFGGTTYILKSEIERLKKDG